MRQRTSRVAMMAAALLAHQVARSLLSHEPASILSLCSTMLYIFARSCSTSCLWLWLFSRSNARSIFSVAPFSLPVPQLPLLHRLNCRCRTERSPNKGSLHASREQETAGSGCNEQPVSIRRGAEQQAVTLPGGPHPTRARMYACHVGTLMLRPGLTCRLPDGCMSVFCSRNASTTWTRSPAAGLTNGLRDMLDV